MRQKF